VEGREKQAPEWLEALNDAWSAEADEEQPNQQKDVDSQ
jgi:hypothetical protein